MDIKYQVICEWVERDLLKLERIDTTINLADLFTKHLSLALFYRHTDYVLGKFPPHYAGLNPRFHHTPTANTVSGPPVSLDDIRLTHATLWTTIAHDPFSSRSSSD